MPALGTLGWIVDAVGAHGALVGQACALVAGLALVVLAVRRRPAPAEGVSPHLTQDGAHIVFRAAVLLPITAWLLGALDDAVTRSAPGLRLDLLGALPMPLQFVAFVVLADLTDYGIHRLFHTVPWLWEFHAIHHSQTWISPLTTTRTHPVELVIKRVLTWAPLVLLGGPHQPWVLWIAIDGFWGFFVHSGLPITLGPLRWLVVSPTFHALHHSSAPEHRDVNLGERLSIWDTLFGTACHQLRLPAATGIDDPRFPLEREPGALATVRAWWRQFAHPFRQLRAGHRSRPARSAVT